MNLTEYLFTRLRELGVDRTFGIPGDFVLPVYAVQAEFGMPTVVCSHEPGVGFAADAYARMRGLGVAIITYGAGGFNILNPIAGAYAEQSPVLVVSGGPEVRVRQSNRLVHHMVKHFDSQLQIFREVTVDAAVLEEAASAPELIDRVLRQVVTRRRPGYLEIPRDRVRVEVSPPAQPLLLTSPNETTDTEALEEAIQEIWQALNLAQNPVLYVGVGVRRYQVMPEIVRLAERWKLPVVSSVLGKASFPESHPQFVGVYMGAMGDPETRQLIEAADCVLRVGVIQSDTNTGFWTAALQPKQVISIDPDATQIRHHRFDKMTLDAVVKKLCECEPTATRPALVQPPVVKQPVHATNAEPLQTADVIEVLQQLDQSRYSFVTDVGDCWFVGLELRADILLSPGYYASMGFAVPAALGVGMAEPKRRPLALVGDGAFQMTGTELATMIDEQLKPIIILLNNSCYVMLEALDKERQYYHRRPWNYLQFAASMGCPGIQARTRAEFEQGLRQAEATDGPFLVEAILNKADLSPMMRRIQQHIRTAQQPTPVPAPAPVK